MILLPNSTYVELYSEMAEAILLDHHSEAMDIYVTEKNGDTRHTNDAQELFEEYCGLVEGVLETVGIGQEPEAAPAMTMSDKIADIIAEHWCSLTGNIDQHDMADAILEALPSMITPLVWSKDVEYFSYATTQTGQYQVREAESGWYVQLDCYRSILVAEQLESREQGKAAANTHHRDASMAALTGDQDGG